MCGIAGIFHRGRGDVEAEAVRAITRALAHRGPDGEGVWVDRDIGLGHRRLAVLDLTPTGAQPMAGVDGRYWVTFNGEIYNFVELRRELEALGLSFRSQSDTEVIIAAYHAWGEDCVRHFNGMWAFAIWDTLRRELFLSRDRFGIKPLFYLDDPGRFVFASELKAFLFLHDFTPRQNDAAVKQALARTAFELSEETLLEGVLRLHPGHNVTVTADTIRVRRWWRTLDHTPEVPRGFADQAEQFRDLFLDACRLRLRSDVPVATCLSGGLDSSSVVCSLAEIRDRDLGGRERRATDFQRTYVAAFPGSWKDESAHAELVVRRTRARPRYCSMAAELALESLNQFVYDFEAFGGSLLVPVWSIYRELRRDGVVVSLDGHGGDELLGGYRDHVTRALETTSLLRVRRVVELARTLQPFYPFGDVTAAGLLRRRLRQTPLGRAARTVLVPLVPRRSGGPMTTTFLRSEAEPPRGSWVDDEDEVAAASSLGAVNRILYAHFHYTVLPSVLRNFERCSMAHGVEVRMPFMDWRLVTFAFALPDESKIGGGYTKRVLRQAMRGTLPEPVRARRDKIGFTPPLAAWLEGALGDWVWEKVRSRDFLDSHLWDGPRIRDFVASRRTVGRWNEDDSETVWPFVHAQLWREVFLGSKGRL